MQNSYDFKRNKIDGCEKNTCDTYADAISIVCIWLFLALCLLWRFYEGECEY